jgi:hypothetical protein
LQRKCDDFKENLLIAFGAIATDHRLRPDRRGQWRADTIGFGPPAWWLMRKEVSAPIANAGRRSSNLFAPLNKAPRLITISGGRHRAIKQIGYPRLK